MHSSVARSVVLLPLLVGLITSCHGGPDGASPGQSSQALQGVHRVQASGDAARQLLARGGRLIADYGGYA
ncbi:MAG TPA: hypothetical protein VFB81_11080, partial [Myxococcales bacterium]|nr:hypothetical protein [Myxococcales bacterium]